MRTLTRVGFIFVLCTLTLAIVSKTRAQGAEDNVKTFFDSEMPGIKIQANATAETRPTGNLTVWLSLTPQTNVYVEFFRLKVYGFLNGTDRVSIGNITGSNLPNGTPSKYTMSFPVEEGVWGVTFGEMTLTYSISLGALELRFPNAVSGFYMTQVENTFLDSLQSQLMNLNQSYNQLNGTYYNLTSAYIQLNQTLGQLQQNYTSLQGNINELDNTRRAAVVLAITTVFFVATTVFTVMRRPKESW